MKMRRILLALLCLLVVPSVAAERHLVAQPVEQAPSVDGRADDAVWSRATEVVTRDRVSGIEVKLKAVYTRDEIYFLVQYPDDVENRDHKTLHWDESAQRYRTGPEREDTFVLKWSMEPRSVDLSLSADSPYKADVWYWKSHRTDHAGYADDKYQIYSAVASPRAKKLRSKSGAAFYLTRRGDDGRAAYEGSFYDRRVNADMPKYELRPPEGSRADIQAKGNWQDGVWTIEFRRKLNTGHGDDVRFDTARSYQFGTSRFEIAGRKPNRRIREPRFGSGEVGELLTLTFG